MSETKWTDEQQQAIDTRKCNLLVAAAAGSGKTAVLVERIIKIITNEENPVDIDKLLVVTFTSAAAAEMRERIAAAISKALEKNPNSKNLQKQLTLLSRANITTMHSFCLDVIKNYFYTIDLDPSFRIADETEITLMKNEIIEDIFEELYEEDNEYFKGLVEAYSTAKDDEKLKDDYSTFEKRMVNRINREIEATDLDYRKIDQYIHDEISERSSPRYNERNKRLLNKNMIFTIKFKLLEIFIIIFKLYHICYNLIRIGMIL